MARRTDWQDLGGRYEYQGKLGECGSEDCGRIDQLNDDPQPQVRVAFGFEMWNPASFRPSL